jgi:hypothetical protein
MMTFWKRLVDLFAPISRQGDDSTVVYMIGYEFWWVAPSPLGAGQFPIG